MNTSALIESLTNPGVVGRLVCLGRVCLPLLLGAGCATTGQPPVLSADESLGRMALVVFSGTNKVQILSPSSKAEASSECAGRCGAEPLRESVGDVRVMAVALAWMPVGLLVGGIYGAIKGESTDDLSAETKALCAAVNDCDITALLQNEIHAGVPPAERDTLARLSADELVYRPASYSTAQLADLTYTNLAARGIDTVLEVRIFNPALEGSEGVNPRLALSFDVRVRVLATRNDHVIFYDYMEYRSEKNTFSKWAANDASRLRTELDSATAVVSREIVRQVFVRQPDIFSTTPPPLRHRVQSIPALAGQ